METLEEKVLNELKNLDKKFSKDEFANEFEKSKKEFTELVEKGIIKRRGNNLLSPTDAHTISRVSFNAK